MSHRSALGRHRAEPLHTNPLTSISKAVSSNAGSVGRQAAVIVAASGLVLTAGVPATVASDTPRQVSSSGIENYIDTSVAAVSASAEADVAFERQAVKATPAPEPVAAEPVSEPVLAEQAPIVQVPAAQAPAVEEIAPAPAPVPVTPAPSPAVTAAVETAPAAEPKPAPAPPASGIGAALVASAYSQMGATQDCTILVEVALRSIGKSVGDLGPTQFYQYGTVVSTPAPGDLVIRPGHVAIYVGNGQVISSGMNGVNATILHPLSDLAGSSFVRVNP